jgi:RNA polymerase sigma factor (sigma-70 family)
LALPLADDESPLEPYYDWESDYLEQELSQDTQQALAQLPEEYRWTVLLVDVENFSYQEIAQVLSCPLGTVMSRINRGRRMLARLLRSPAKREAGPRLAENFEEEK